MEKDLDAYCIIKNTMTFRTNKKWMALKVEWK